MRTQRTADRILRSLTCPRCGDVMVQIVHVVGEGPSARPCGCPVAYRIDRSGIVNVHGRAA